MLWNWYTVDSCFLASSWHVRSRAAFAGTCIGVLLLVLLLEAIRRAQREFDRYLVKLKNRQRQQHQHQHQGHLANVETAFGAGANGDLKGDGVADGVQQHHDCTAASSSAAHSLLIWEHTVRSLLYTMQFALAYIIMLLAMYYNGSTIPPLIRGRSR